jgi:hypothetical protein
MTEHYSEQQVSELFDQLIDAQADLRHHQRVWEDYRKTSPHRPASFESVQSLTDYNERIERWEREERALGERASMTTRQLKSVYERVKEVLPIDSSVTRTYGGGNAERQGRYRITYTTDDIRAVILDSHES